MGFDPKLAGAPCSCFEALVFYFATFFMPEWSLPLINIFYHLFMIIILIKMAPRVQSIKK